VTVGARDDGDLVGLRLAASASEITDFRAETQVGMVDVGRDFLDERLAIDLGGIAEHNRDAGAGAAACPTPSASTLAPGCFGRRTGWVWQAGATVAVRPAPKWFVLVDYRLILDEADGGQGILTHVGFLRVEVRM
jgi:hypothetical protein